MNRDWAQYWINLFAANTDELMTLYSPEFEFEDVNFEVRISKDLPALRGFFENFVIADRSQGYNDFDVFDYVDDLAERRRREPGDDLLSRAAEEAAGTVPPDSELNA